MIPRSLALLPLLLVAGLVALPAADPVVAPVEAPASFQLVSNGVTSQADFLANLAQFSQDHSVDGDDDPGLGPIYNATSCLACHGNPVAGGESQVFELRVGHWDGSTFTAPPGGTLVRHRSIDPAAQQRVPDGFEVRGRRRSTSLFGLGFIESVRDTDLTAIRDAQPPEVRGYATKVLVTTGIAPDGTLTQVEKVGRFGWKAQHGSLLDFAADALLNEIGVTSPIQPKEVPSIDGRSLAAFDRSADPEDQPTAAAPFGADVTAYTRLMRSLQCPPRDFTLQATDDARAGERLFASIGCAACHVPTLTTAPAGSTPAGMQPVPAALGSKTFHPYSDFLLHALDSADGIQQGEPATRDKMRTAPLWGLRCRPELMHDGLSYTIGDAVERHGGQGAASRAAFRALTDGERRQLLTFLRSL